MARTRSGTAGFAGRRRTGEAATAFFLVSRRVGAMEEENLRGSEEEEEEEEGEWKAVSWQVVDVRMVSKIGRAHV